MGNENTPQAIPRGRQQSAATPGTCERAAGAPPTPASVGGAVDGLTDPAFPSTGEVVRRDRTGALDGHLRQRRILATEQRLDDADRHAKAMLAGLYPMARAARETAVGADSSGDSDGSGVLIDAALTAAPTGGAALSIVDRAALAQHAFRITEDERADRGDFIERQ